MAQDVKTGQGTGNGPMDRLKTEASGLVTALGDRAMSSVRDKMEGATGRLTEYVDGGAGPGLIAAVTGAKDAAEGKGPVRSMLGAGFKGASEKVKGLFGKDGKGGGGKGKKLKVTNIVESIDVGVPIELAYNQWTQFTDFPSFTKKVENVEQVEDEKLHWKAQVLWSHREWDADIIEQIPDQRIIWQSKGAKGHVDGAVTFHELAPELTRILVVLEYHPQGFFEHTGNLWRAQGRRARLELKHFRRHLMTSPLSRIVSMTSASPDGDGPGPPVCMPVLIGCHPLVSRHAGGPCAAGALLPRWTGQSLAGVPRAGGHAPMHGTPRCGPAVREPPGR